MPSAVRAAGQAAMEDAGDAAANAGEQRDRYADALRAGALLVVVFGHWIATLPRLADGRLVDTEHLLRLWPTAGLLTWVLQVVPLFVFVSAAVSADGVARRLHAGGAQRHWWAARALGMARPAATYLGVLAVLVLVSRFTGAPLMGPFDHSLTVHLWFLLMLLAVQALLPLGVRADARFGLGAVGGVLLAVVAVDLLRGGITGAADLRTLGARVTDGAGGVGWLNLLLVWLLPQQLGIAWRRGRLGGAWTGLALLALGAGWLAAAVASGYPVAMVGGDLDGNSNLLPPTLALVGVMWLQVGAVLLCAASARRYLERHRPARVVAMLGALGMPLYLWHKLAELPAAWLGARLGLPIDAGIPGEAGFWIGRAWWIGSCLVMAVPVIAAVLAFELRRAREVPAATPAGSIVAGGTALFAGLAASLVLGAWPGALVGLAGVALASWLLRARRLSR